MQPLKNILEWLIVFRRVIRVGTKRSRCGQGVGVYNERPAVGKNQAACLRIIQGELR